MAEANTGRSASKWGRTGTLALAGALLAALLALSAPTPARAVSTTLKEELQPFAECPVYTGAAECVAGITSGGEISLGRKAGPITNPVYMKGGFAEGGLSEPSPLLGPTSGEALSAAPQKLPGGLAGLELLGLELGGEVTATAELVGGPGAIRIDRVAFAEGSLIKEPAVTLPIRVKLSNEVLGDECYVGTDSEPIVLHLTTGETHPPAPGTPLQGARGPLVLEDKGLIWYFEHTVLVDNDFPVPGATGCGGALSAVVDPIVDADAGLPAAPGESKAVMTGSLEQTPAYVAKKIIPKPKKVKTSK